MLDLPALAKLAEAAADRARAEILPRFRKVATEIKSDGSPVTEADRAAEDTIRELLARETPDFAIFGEERGGETSDGPTWIIDPIDGTIAFARGIPLFGTAIALVVNGDPVLGLIDLPALDERYLAWRGGGARRNGAEVRVSGETELGRAFACVGDRDCFELVDELALWDTLWSRAGRVRGYSDVFGHSLVLSGSSDVMVDLHLHPWDVAPVRILTTEAGGAVARIAHPNGLVGLVVGAPRLVEQLAGYASAPVSLTRPN